MEKVAYIYALLEPNGAAVRYIGKSTDPEKRLAAHLITAQQSSKAWRVLTPVENWILALRDEGKVPRIRTLEQCPSNNWSEREDYWIAYCLNAGRDLLNCKFNTGEKLDHAEYYKQKKYELTEKAYFAFIVRQIPGQPFIWDGEPRWLKMRILLQRDSKRFLNHRQEIVDQLNDFDFSTLNFHKLVMIMRLIEGKHV